MTKLKKLRIAILAGEASGDALGASLIQKFRAIYPNAEFEGIGGQAMIAAGCHSLFDIERLAVMGFIEPLFRLPDLIRLRSQLLQHLLKNPPDVFIGIDAPDFNLGLERRLRRHGIPVIHYVSPSVWAWRQRRIKKIASAVDLMLTLLPFEKKIYEENKIPVQYVGHPLAQNIPLYIDTLTAKRALCLNEKDTYIALLPGSRSQEIKYLGEAFLKAADQLWRRFPHLKFLTTHINEQRYQEFNSLYQQHAPDLPITFYTRRAHDVMAAADIVMVTSGTATLETMLYKKPMVIAYRMAPLTYKIAKRLVKTKYIGLPNLLADAALVPELIQNDANPKQIAAAVSAYLEDPAKSQALTKQFIDMHQQLLHDAVTDITSAIQQVIDHQIQGLKSPV